MISLEFNAELTIDGTVTMSGYAVILGVRKFCREYNSAVSRDWIVDVYEDYESARKAIG